jgi:hypothetical protein
MPTNGFCCHDQLPTYLSDFSSRRNRHREPVVREVRQSEAGLRGAIVVPRYGGGTVDDSPAAEQVLTVAGAGGQPAGASDHVTQFRYSPSQPSPSPFMMPSVELINFFSDVGSANSPMGVGVTQPGGRSDDCCCASAAAGVATTPMMARKRNADIRLTAPPFEVGLRPDQQIGDHPGSGARNADLLMDQQPPGADGLRRHA